MASHGTRVLVVDDELFFREAIVDLLTAAGIECGVSEDGEGALAAMADPSIGAVVLDIRLPGLDGIEVLRRIREQRPEVRVIMLSASTDQELVLEALRLGACDYLAKPLHEEELRLAVVRALEGHSLAANWGYLKGRLEELVEVVQQLGRRVAESEPELLRMAILQQGAAQAASQVLQARKASLMVLDETGGSLQVVAAVGRDLEPEEMTAVAPGEGVAGRVLESGEAILVNDVSGDDRISGDGNSERYETKSFAIAPVGSHEARFGVLCVTDRRDGGDYGEDDLALLRLLALQIGELMRSHADGPDVGDRLEGERASGASGASERDAAAESSDGELARLVCDAVVSEVQPQRILESITRSLSEQLGAAPVSIFLLDGATGGLVLEGEYDGGIRGERNKLEVGRGLTGLVMQSGNLVASQDPAADPRFDSDVDTPDSGEAAPFLCIPLQLRGKVFGVFRAFLAEGALPSAQTGEVLAAALSAAARNVLLYRSLVSSIAEVAEARRGASRPR